VIQVDSQPRHPEPDTSGHASLALVQHLDFSAYYKLENVVHLLVANVHRQIKMHDLFTVSNR